MFNNNKITPYIFVFLAFCVVSSKHLIIYNEEILVALSFLFFVIFVSYYFGNTIKESLDERSSTIQLELQNFLNLKKDCLNTLFKVHEKAFLSNTIVNNLTKFTSSKVKSRTKGSEKALRNIFSQQINNKLKNLSYSNLNLKSKLQQIISDQLLTAVLVKNKKTKTNLQNNTQLNLNYLKKAIQTFSQ